MSYEKITCRIAIQMCVGHFPDGRERHRTFSLKHIKPDVSMEAIRGIIRSLAPVLAYPITKVTKVTKTVLFSEEDAEVAIPAQQADAEPVPAAPEERLIIPFPVLPVTEFQAARNMIEFGAAASSCFAAGQMGFMQGRAPPTPFDR